MSKLFWTITLTVSLGLFAVKYAAAEETSVKVDKISTAEDTTISIKKGSQATDSKVRYDITTGEDELSSDEEYDAKKALESWRQACADWKKEIKELNKDAQIISMSCGAKTKTKDQNKVTYHSTATYKIRVKVQE